MGGAVENLIARLQGYLKGRYEFHHVSVMAPREPHVPDPRFSNATVHSIQSIDPLQDLRPDNHFELQESDKWNEYGTFCIETVRRVRPDIIHIHNEVRLAIAIAEIAPYAAILAHVNDEVVTRLSACDLKKLSASLDLLLSCSRYIYSQIEEAFAAYKLIAPSHEIFYNFVDLNEFNPERIDPTILGNIRERYCIADHPVVLFVGRMIEQKGPHLVLQAVRWARERGADVKILFVGAPWYSRDSATPWLEFLLKQCGDLGKDSIFTGYVPHGDMPTHYALGDIVTVPSIWDDPSPFVAYEAQAMGRPVIASRRGGIPEIAEDRISGRCIDVFNVPLFGEIIMSWLSNPGKRARLGAEGRARMAERFSLVRAGEQMDQIYRRLIGARPKTA
jgi:glycosyltransferase involved in cell wall biosynthesis